ncbi:hypothetical protein GIV19_12385 [Pseudomonas syringae]|nr:hypothetical protein [Pseudomonas syringae]MCF5708085.1 hypothetical protein [Pseudomonas syringae]
MARALLLLEGNNGIDSRQTTAQRIDINRPFFRRTGSHLWRRELPDE